MNSWLDKKTNKQNFTQTSFFWSFQLHCMLKGCMALNISFNIHIFNEELEQADTLNIFDTVRQRNTVIFMTFNNINGN